MDFTVTIDQFDGPLDLMLHLIKEGKLDLFDLNIAQLTDQYLAYINAMQDLHLEIASEYLVELATLIEYKSKKLLPNDKDELQDDYEDESEQLVRRLIEYQKFKEVSQAFEERYQERSLSYDKPASEITNDWIKVDENLEESSPYELIKAMNKVLQRQQLANPYEYHITTKEITMEERMIQLTSRIDHWGNTFSMQQTMDDCQDTYTIVITFIALLDMINSQQLNFTVSNEEVYFTKGVAYGKASSLD